MYGINSGALALFRWWFIQITGDIVSQNDLRGTKDGLLEAGQCARCAITYETNQGRNTLEAILVEFGVTWVLADFAEDVDQAAEYGFMNRREALSSGDDHPHCACYVSMLIQYQSGDLGRRTFHEVVVLSDFLWCSALLDVGKQSHENVFGKWPDICLVETASSAEFISRLGTYSACRSTLMKRIRSIVIAA